MGFPPTLESLHCKPTLKAEETQQNLEKCIEKKGKGVPTLVFTKQCTEATDLSVGQAGISTPRACFKDEQSAVTGGAMLRRALYGGEEPALTLCLSQEPDASSSTVVSNGALLTLLSVLQTVLPSPFKMPLLTNSSQTSAMT